MISVISSIMALLTLILIPVVISITIGPTDEIEEDRKSIELQMAMMDKHDRIRKFLQDAMSNAVYLRIMSEWERIKDPRMFTEERMRNVMSEIILDLREHMYLETVMGCNDIFDISYYEKFMIDTGLEVGRNIHKELVDKANI